MRPGRQSAAEIFQCGQPVQLYLQIVAALSRQPGMQASRPEKHLVTRRTTGAQKIWPGANIGRALPWGTTPKCGHARAAPESQFRLAASRKRKHRRWSAIPIARTPPKRRTQVSQRSSAHCAFCLPKLEPLIANSVSTCLTPQERVTVTADSGKWTQSWQSEVLTWGGRMRSVLRIFAILAF